MKYSFLAKASSRMNVSKKTFFGIRALLIELLILISCHCIGQAGKVHIKGDFPNVAEAHFWSIPLKIDIPLVEGKLDIWLDSINAGIYPFGISFPIADSFYITRRGKDGKIKYIESTGGEVSIFSYIYLNPEQASVYALEPVRGLTIDKMKRFKQFDNDRSDVFSINVRSESEDSRIYQRLQKIKENYQHQLYYKILDSLYQNSTAPDKFYSDFAHDAYQLNRKLNFSRLLNQERAFAARHLQSPIAPLALLDADSAHLADHLNAYRQLLNKMSGRAIRSDYYKNLILKIQSLRGVKLKKGDPFPMPSGKTPDAEKLSFHPSDYTSTLIVFWASWCVPCRAENPELNALQREYKSRGFQILAVSLDEYPQEWRAAIKKDRLTDWLHICDQQSAWNCPNALRYGIKSIPSNFLIDTNGIILDKNISLKDLKAFLESTTTN